MPNGELVPLTPDSLLLKGCQLRNTGWCYGIAIYTGHQTKIMKNSLESRSKKSKIELATNHYIIIIVLIQMLICVGSAFCNCIWVNVYGHNVQYLGFVYDPPIKSYFSSYLTSFLTWFIALMNFVSISLLVTLEMVKFFQAYFIEQDCMMYDI